MNDALPAAGFHFVFGGWPFWIVLPVGLLLAWAATRMYRRESMPLNGLGRVLRALRFAVVLLISIMATQPVIRHVSRVHEPAAVIVLRDVSASMSVRDTHVPPEWKVRAAASLGLLKSSARTTEAEDAALSLRIAGDAVETAATGVRRIAQSIEDESENPDAITERLRETARALANAAVPMKRAQDLLIKADSGSSGLPGVINSSLQTLQRLEEAFNGLPTAAESRAKLLRDHSESLRLLARELAKQAADARKLQDARDRAVGRSNAPEVAKALRELDGMDRAAMASTFLEKSIYPEYGDAVRIIPYDFDTDLHEPGESATAGGGGDTDLATALLRVIERHAQESIAAVVVVSDGRHTTGPSPEDAARALAGQRIDLHTLGVGSQEAVPDLCVARLDGTLSVFRDETIHLTAHIKTQELAGRNCSLTISRGGKVLQTRKLTLPGGGWLRETFEIPADTAGVNIFTAAIEPLDGEAVTTNNRAEAVVDVANDRLRVLIVDELPRWETRFLESLLKRDRKVMLESRWLRPAALGGRGRMLPEQQRELQNYDVIVLGDIGPDALDEEGQKRIARYVADWGGFLVVVAGPRAMPRSFSTGALADVLPIVQSQSGAPPLSARDAEAYVRVKLAPEAPTHEITQVLRDPTLNERLWPALPELHWATRPAFAKPGAVPLLATDDARRDAIAVVHNYGAGRVLYLGTDSAWRWRQKTADRIHSAFWSQAIRWGTGSRLSGGERLKIGVDRRQIRRGESVEVRARPRTPDGRLMPDAALIAETTDGDRPQRVRLQPSTDGSGLYRGSLQNLGTGVRTIRVTIESEKVFEETQVIVRQATGQEGMELSRDTVRLAAMAQIGGGRHLDLLDAGELFTNLGGQGKERAVATSFDAWCSYPMVVLIVALLVAEWLLRKRAGLS